MLEFAKPRSLAAPTSPSVCFTFHDRQLSPPSQRHCHRKPIFPLRPSRGPATRLAGRFEHLAVPGVASGNIAKTCEVLSFASAKHNTISSVVLGLTKCTNTSLKQGGVFGYCVTEQ